MMHAIRGSALDNHAVLCALLDTEYETIRQFPSDEHVVKQRAF